MTVCLTRGNTPLETNFMSSPEYLLTFELSKDGDELAIHLDEQGLVFLLSTLHRLQNGSSPPPKHIHLMTNEWGGDELSNEAQSPSSTLLNKVDLRLWKK